MKKIFTFLISFFIITISSFADESGYTIKNYNLYGKLNEKNQLSVTETITVDFYEKRHGIYRTIPTYFTINVTDNGENKLMTYKEKFSNISTGKDKSSTDDDNGLVIQIGDANKTIEGEHTYTISYTCTIYDDRIDLYDFFYFSPLGSSWDTTIDNFTFQIDFEKPLPQDTKFQLYSGPANEIDNILNVKYDYSSNSIYGNVQNVPNNNSVTVFCKLPQGYFTDTIKMKPFLSWFFGILAIIVFFVTLYYLFTTKHKNPVQTVEFYPPDNISPAEVGFIIDNNADDIDFLSLYPYWAQKGYISISEESKSFTLTKLKDLPEDSPMFMKTFFKATFAESDTFTLSDIDESFIKEIDSAKKSLKQNYTGEHQLYENTALSKLVLWGSFIFTALSLGFSSTISLTENMFNSLILIPELLLGLLLNNRAFFKYFKKSKKIFKTIILIICIILLFPMTINLFSTECLVSLTFVLILISTFTLVCLLNGLLITRTDYNLEISGKLLGLKEFIKTAELPRLMEITEENQYYYYDIFPYTMVFELADKWAKQFKSLNLQAPKWYTSNNATVYFNHYDFTKSFTNIVSTQVNSVRSAISSSSGGGSSGGGAGGGGGGSW